MSALALTEGEELARSLDESLAKILDTETLLASAGSDEALAASTTATIVELGVHGVAVTESAGGLGLNLGDRARLAAVFGRRLVPAALRDECFGLAPALAALAAEGSEAAAELLGRAVEGELRGAVALTPRPAPGTLDPTAIAASAANCEALVVLGQDRLELYGLEEGGAALTPLAGLDPGQGLSRVSLGEASPLASIAGAAAPGLRRDYELALICEAFGCGERTLEVSVEYAGQREQFGRPIAAFQAVAHLLAEIKLGIETSRAGIGRFVDLAGEEGASGTALDGWAATLAHTVPAAARRACEGAIQVHGGIGFSWELGLHLSYRRILAVQYLLGGDGPTAELVGAEYLTKRSER
jgi:alkylation response protein AidB-like acyl-CoA dehydrogenase